MIEPKLTAMTTRQRLRGWFTFLKVALILVGVLAYGWRDNGYNTAFRITVLSVLIAMVFGLFASGFRCPACRKSLLPKASAILSSGGRFACPKCGGSIDEPTQR